MNVMARNGWIAGLLLVFMTLMTHAQGTPDQRIRSNWANYPIFAYPRDLNTSDLYGNSPKARYPKDIVRRLEQLQSYWMLIDGSEQWLKWECLTNTAKQKMVFQVKGKRILINPALMKGCDDRVPLMRDGNAAHDRNFAALNDAYGTRYPVPRGDSTLLAQWSDFKSSFVSFEGAGCNEASAKIVYGDSASAKAIFDTMKNTCGREWAGLFEDVVTADAAGKDGKEKQDCPKPLADGRQPGPVPLGCEQEAVADPNADADPIASAKPKGASVDDELNDLRNRSRPKATPDPSNAGQASKRNNGTLVEQQRGSMQGLGHNALQATPIFGGESGKILQQLAQVGAETERAGTTGNGQSGTQNNGTGCNSDGMAKLDRELGVQLNSPRFKNMSTEMQQCEMARVYFRYYQQLLPYAERCNPSAVAEVQRGLSDVQSQQRQLCR